jgi:hypothetical protein
MSRTGVFIKPLVLASHALTSKLATSFRLNIREGKASTVRIGITLRVPKMGSFRASWHIQSII